MAKKFLTDLDLNKNELQNAVVQNLSAAPSNPKKGQLYCYTVDNTLYFWNGTAWIPLGTSGGSGGEGGPVTIVESTGSGDTLKTYTLYQDGVALSPSITIPKDFLVKSGTIIDVIAYNNNYYNQTDTSHEHPLPVSAAGKYLDFVINTVGNDGTASHIYIAVSDLVDAYTAGSGIDIGVGNVISVKVHPTMYSTTGLAANGLGVGGDGLSLTVVTPSVNGVGGGNGAMIATDKEKLDGITAGAQPNQNAFSNIKVGGTTIAAGSAMDTIEFVAGTNITLQPNATTKKVAIFAADSVKKYNIGNPELTPNSGGVCEWEIPRSSFGDVYGLYASCFLCENSSKNEVFADIAHNIGNIKIKIKSSDVIAESTYTAVIFA